MSGARQVDIGWRDP